MNLYEENEKKRLIDFFFTINQIKSNFFFSFPTITVKRKKMISYFKTSNAR